MLPFGVLIFVVGALLVTNAVGRRRRQDRADAAAREAVRAYVEAPDAASGAVAARAAAVATMVGHGRRPDLLVLSIHHAGDQPFARCVAVTVEVHYPVPAIRLPWIGGFGHAFDVVSTHTERIDPFRSGLTGVGTC